MRPFWQAVLTAAISGLLLVAPAAQAERIHVAVAANFTAPAQALARIFAQETGNRAELSFGATGAFYAQIRQGAPFDVLLAADAERPKKLEAEGAIQPGSRFTYAIGKLALWSARPGVVDDQGAVLQHGTFRRLAIANPKLAPYGAAAEETLAKLGLKQRLQSRLVLGESIGQTFNFVATGNAELGFVALSQVLAGQKDRPGSFWIVPAGDYAPIVQDAVILKRAQHNRAAQAWVALLRSPGGQTLIRRYGYAVPAAPTH